MRISEGPKLKRDYIGLKVRLLEKLWATTEHGRIRITDVCEVTHVFSGLGLRTAPCAGCGIVLRRTYVPPQCVQPIVTSPRKLITFYDWKDVKVVPVLELGGAYNFGSDQLIPENSICTIKKFRGGKLTLSVDEVCKKCYTQGLEIILCGNLDTLVELIDYTGESNG